MLNQRLFSGVGATDTTIAAQRLHNQRLPFILRAIVGKDRKRLLQGPHDK